MRRTVLLSLDAQEMALICAAFDALTPDFAVSPGRKAESVDCARALALRLNEARSQLETKRLEDVLTALLDGGSGRSTHAREAWGSGKFTCRAETKSHSSVNYRVSARSRSGRSSD